MNNAKKMQFPQLSNLPKWVLPVGGLLLTEIIIYMVVYYWRVFYYLDARAFPVNVLTLGMLTLGLVVYGIAMLLVYCTKTVAVKAACGVFAVGLIFVFANPPLQAPDEQLHFLRSYSISEGNFDFDLDRAYPESVDLLIQTFPGAWVNAHTSQGLHQNENDEEAAYSTAGYALKQYGEDGKVTGVADSFAAYLVGDMQGVKAATEPLSFVIFPYLPAALGMAIARLFGLAALGSLYGGRIANLAFYAVMCYVTLKNTKRFQSVFLALMFLPMSLYMAASLNYDALLLGFYWYALSFLTRDGQSKLTKRDFIGFFAVFVGMNTIKPWISLLFLAVIYIIPATAWPAAPKCQQRQRKLAFAVGCVASSFAVTMFVAWYGNAFRFNYPELGRMLGDTVNGGEQLVFVLSNPLRYIAVMVGTLYENDLFLGQLGVFGSLDLPISLINICSPLLILWGAALSVHHKNTLRPWTAAGLGTLTVAYAGALLTALYLTYTPVAMVRVVGLQARYFLPVFLMLGVLLASGLSHLLDARAKPAKAVSLAFWSAGAFALVGGVLLFQHHFIGPIYTI